DLLPQRSALSRRAIRRGRARGLPGAARGRHGAPPAPLAVPPGRPASASRGGPRVPPRARPGVRARFEMIPDVSILVVSKEDAADLPVSLGSALAQRGAACETLLVDNASTDDSREVARGLGVRVLALPENVGFAAAMNAGIEATSGRYVLALNPDCRLEPDFAAILARRLDAADARDVGSASGRLLRADGPALAANGLLDSTG